jgi:hypothetical protein
MAHMDSKLYGLNCRVKFHGNIPSCNFLWIISYGKISFGL